MRRYDPKKQIDEYNSLLKELEKQGYEISPGLTDAEREELEGLYGIRFPRALSEFLSCGLPVGKEPRADFPIWRDKSEENVAIIRKRLASPIEWLALDVKDGFWLDAWGEWPEEDDEALAKFSAIAAKAPKLIPIFAHRYVPVIEGVDDPPVISTWGSDIIYYGCNLSDYLKCEFLNMKGVIYDNMITRIPFWSEIIDWD